MAIPQQDYERYMKEIQAEIDIEKQRSGEMVKAHNAQQSLFNQENEENLIKWQLDMREDLDRLYHLLKGDILKEDADGEVDYAEPENPDLKPFNEFGVQLLMNIMSFYLNRNTILSNYDLNTIEWKIYDFGICVSDLIFNRYDEMMLTLDPKEHTTEEIELHIKNKLKMFPIIVQELVDTVHSAYLRAYNGGERESLRTARSVTQSISDGSNRYNTGGGMYSPQPQRRLLKPWTW